MKMVFHAISIYTGKIFNNKKIICFQSVIPPEMQNQFIVKIINNHVVHGSGILCFIYFSIYNFCLFFENLAVQIVKFCNMHWYITLSMKIGLEYFDVNSVYYTASNILFGVEFIECFYLFIVFELLRLIDVNWLLFALVFIPKWYALESRLNISLKALEYQIVDFFSVFFDVVAFPLYACKKRHFSSI